jgi:hypothetical protein
MRALNTWRACACGLIDRKRKAIRRAGGTTAQESAKRKHDTGETAQEIGQH